jgi:hypothetical protein
MKTERKNIEKALRIIKLIISRTLKLQEYYNYVNKIIGVIFASAINWLRSSTG